ncbi:extracellular solute-binding protein family 3 [Candidatus Moduliflexus flocculans]|uniref:Extracellular solute-binding protein family 3 n=1 Tax=Candidatus Moduliflexus flocculans TaxID=1499966 RepID=A0A0S6VSD9_9BACT|nr:extracellular solute-binding protein family 3 [Candidatus Moduliflexus flocculans]
MKQLRNGLLLAGFITAWGCGIVSAQTAMRLGTDDWKPYEFRQEKELTGYSVEVVQQVFKQMGIEISSLEIFPWARAEWMVFNGELDALFSVTKSQKREEACFFPSEALAQSDWVLFIRKSDVGQLKFDTLEDLKGKQIGVVREHAYTPEFWEFLKREKNYEEVAADAQNFQKLAAHRVDYVVSEYAVGMSLLNELGLIDKIVALAESPLKRAELFIMFSKKTVSAEIVAQFSETLRQFKTTLAFQEIAAKYLRDAAW